MTKVSVFGEQPTEQPKELKKIKFVKALVNEFAFDKSCCSPKSWANLMLLEKEYTKSGLDLIMAWDDISDKTIYLGHWNDGVV